MLVIIIVMVIVFKREWNLFFILRLFSEDTISDIFLGENSTTTEGAKYFQNFNLLDIFVYSNDDVIGKDTSNFYSGSEGENRDYNR